jgi:DNA-binding LacI/PurR family transcriptional regulator
MIINSGSRIPKHIQTAVLLKQRIEKGDYAPGAKIPPVRLLGAELGVSSNVIHRAVRILEKEGMVESQHGVGVRVMDMQQPRRTPLTFGMIHPYSPDILFAGTIHCFVDRALDVKKNRCIVKSSYHDAKRERELIGEFIDTGIEGLLVWPCEGNENVEFFKEISEQTPLVFIDRNLEEVAAPSVVLDYAGLGREIITYLGSRGYQKILILEDPLPVSSFREMYVEMKETVKLIGAENRFEFVSLNTSDFVEKYQTAPAILNAGNYEAVFTVQDEFLDYAFINTPLAETYRGLQLFSMSNTLPTPRSPAFYIRTVHEWIGDFGQVIGKATELLHTMVYLRNHLTRQYRIKFSSTVRGGKK